MKGTLLFLCSRNGNIIWDLSRDHCRCPWKQKRRHCKCYERCNDSAYEEVEGGNRKLRDWHRGWHFNDDQLNENVEHSDEDSVRSAYPDLRLLKDIYGSEPDNWSLSRHFNAQNEWLKVKSNHLDRNCLLYILGQWGSLCNNRARWLIVPHGCWSFYLTDNRRCWNSVPKDNLGLTHLVNNVSFALSNFG